MLADSLTKVLNLWAGGRCDGRPTIDICDLDRIVTSEFAHAIRAWRIGGAFPRPRLADMSLARAHFEVNTMTIEDPTTATPSDIG